ncbi:type II/IV secretion system protein [Lactonifactor longoviformis]|uniref:Type IV pilus assembly protein PilB n=1 Tax=Lactonifactor longoviformis DSM 17459 TaxID=1122155 RepID=A0A1M4SZ78_9CLOT|nr:type II/IV secretion system protein [Lactonifactor longoviformis]SHE37501.1 type IV pilus assembly protein PilB [Lactonifactor longoviformis DSM 17459]
MKNIPIGEVLKEYGYITEEQLQRALAYQKEHREKRLGAILMELGFVTEKQMIQALGQRLGMKTVELSQITVNIEAVEKVPRQLAARYHVLPVDTDGQTLTLVTNDPLNFYGLEDIRQLTGMNQEVLLAELAPLNKAIDYYYAEVNARMAAKDANQSIEEPVIEELEVEEGGGDVPVIKLLNSLIHRGYQTNSSDIHIEPFEDKTLVRMRMDGTIVDYVTLQRSLHPSLIARIKIISNLDIAEKRIPQDGHFRIKIENENVNVRVSVIPTVFGEKAVLRLLANNSVIDHAGQYGMNDENYTKFRRMLQSPNGIIYLTGPTGSGKTTTLYMVLEELCKKQVNISTIEDPVEKNLTRVNQMQVNTMAGLTFEVGLRALLRQDPDIIMVGETRDAETASISVRSAITGHLVLSTLHTNNAVSSIVRLVDMGLEPYLIANSLVGVVAQRLMRKLCPHCSYEDMLTYEEAALLGTDRKAVRRAKGCNRCNHTGYQGRIAIHEILLIDKEIRRMISAGSAMEEIAAYALKTQGMKTLKTSALELVETGVTTIEELMKVAYYE